MTSPKKMHKHPKAVATLAQRAEFDEIIDVRSPAEFADDHIPGAINCPVLDNKERETVGTLYKQVSAFEARKLGAALVARNIARHIEERLMDKPRTWHPMICCWRGGMRSESFTTWMRLIGFDAAQLEGGYKQWRHHVLEQLETLPAQYQFRIICGPTGSAKTRLLTSLEAQGAQVLDLEELAAHKGSVLGSLPDRPQPSQKWFETQVAHKLERFDPTRIVFVEAESRKIGRLRVPMTLIAHMHKSECIQIQASRQARIDYLLEDYHYLGEDIANLQSKLELLRGFLENARLERWLTWAQEGNLPELFAELIDKHYDPLYRRSQSNNYTGFDSAMPVPCDDLSKATLSEAAAQIIRKFE